MKRDFYIIDINPSEIKFIEKNARFMSQNEFNALVSNIKRDGQLSSVPFLIKENEIYTVISGNHRIKASIEAGLTSIKAMVGENLSNDEIRAIQLSHNSITGKDDLQILKEIFDEIQNSDLKEYSFIDTSLFEDLEKVNIEIVQPANEFISLNMVFFSAELSKFEDIIQEIETSNKLSDYTIPMPMQEFDNFIEVVGKIKKEYKIKDYGATIIKMAEIVKKQLQN